MEKEEKAGVSREGVLEELVAIGFAKVTDYLFVADGALGIRETDKLGPREQAAIASIERTSGGIRFKFYDKLRALELLGKYLGLFEGGSGTQVEENNLLEAILAASGEEVNTDDLQELQQAAADRPDLVEPAGAESL